MADSQSLPFAAATGTGAEKKQGRITQIVLSLIIFAGFVVLLFVPDAPGGAGSLFDQILDLFGTNFYPTLFSAALYAVIGMYAVLLVCTIVSVFLKNDKAVRLNLLKTIVALLVLLFYIYAIGLPLEKVFRDDSTFIALNSVVISLALGVIALFVLLFTAYKAFGFVKLFSVLFAAGFLAVYSFEFISSYTFDSLVSGIELGTGALNTVTEIVFQVFAIALLANLVIALFSTMGKGTAVLDLVRAVVVFVLAVAAYVLLGIYDGFENGFTYIGTIVSVAIALVQFVFALIVLLVLHARKKREQAAATVVPLAPPAQESPFVVDGNNQMALRGWEEPAVQPAPAAPVFAEEAERTNNAFEAAAQLSFEDIAADAEEPAAETFEEQAAEPAAEAAPEPETADAAAYENVIRDEQEEPAAKEEPKEEKPFDFDQARYDGSFNRAYADYTEKQEAERERPYESYRAATPPPSYYAAPRTYGQSAAQQPAAPYYDTPATAGYVPDAFLNGLNAAERDEFTKLFISRIYGENKRLPVYTVGGDNSEFFAKIFVFMGRYRNVISDGLLEKIYEYSNLIR